MQTTFTLSCPKITGQDLDQLEAEMTKTLRKRNHISRKESIQLPDDYRQFLLSINGGLSFHESFVGAYGKITMYDMFFYGYCPIFHADNYDVDNLCYQWHDYGEYLDYFDGQIVVPIIRLFHNCKGLLVLTGPEKGMIYESDESGHEDGEYVKKIANNFTELFNGADFGIEQGDDFFFHRLLKKCIFLNDYQEWFDYLDSKTFQPEELKDMLWESISLASLPSIERLILMGALPHENFNLFWAKNYSVAEFMLQQGVSVNEPIWKGYSPLAWAAHEGRFEVVKYLISQGADINYVNPENGDSLIKIAQKSLKEYESVYYRDYSKVITDLKATIEYLTALQA